MKDNFFNDNRRNFFRYVLFCHEDIYDVFGVAFHQECPETGNGYRFHGDRLLISDQTIQNWLGYFNWYTNDHSAAQAYVVMHELGHLLGLNHPENDNTRYNINMNINMDCTPFRSQLVKKHYLNTSY